MCKNSAHGVILSAVAAGMPPDPVFQGEGGDKSWR
jgi:hypothetical protein